MSGYQTRIIDIRAAVSYTQPTVDLRVVAAGFTVRAVQIGVIAALDEKGQNKRFLDSVVAQSLPAIGVFKPAADAFDLSDSLTTATQKSFFESLTATDVVLVQKDFLRIFADESVAEDSPAIEVEKPFAHELLAEDAPPVFGISKLFAEDVVTEDLAEVGDGSTYEFSKGLTNVVSLDDVRTYDIAKNLQDALGLSDAVSQTVAKALLDAFSTTELVGTSFTKTLADTISSPDVVSLFTAKAVADSLAVQDALSRVFQKALGDSALVGDAGNLVCQNYCDLTYFESNYVGEYREFA